jgi:hypothetical protein
MRAFPQPNDVALAALRALDDCSCHHVPERVFAFGQPEIATDVFKGGGHDRYMVRLKVRTLQETINRHGPHLTAKKQIIFQYANNVLQI